VVVVFGLERENNEEGRDRGERKKHSRVHVGNRVNGRVK
jgi:hypothetical protein